ncbi:hypothetical protein EV385_1773 [Krasilnikovia cinnamomea]|uniref:Uncharacterized protein n=1 Tax=Krasilnikovia cinnamomea TaxID=349313 RepID=A0A4Q7ZIC8_9ACTN|nr:hypothetical protein [Krasilnikovia cinnamomea]RZU50013.1 hypothetical protein EV385_1773 [Krasilnikovia cinnamomea]
MSDFDVVLERLLNEPSFAAELARDADSALSGYVLDNGEAELLRRQVAADAGAAHAVVETRTSKSSTFGLFSAFTELGAGAAHSGPESAHSGMGGAGDARTGLGSAPSAAGLGPWSEFGTAAGEAAQHAADVTGGTQGFGSAPARGAGGGAPEDLTPLARSGLGAAPESDGAPDLDGLPPVSGLGAAPHTGLGEPSRFQGEAEHLAPPKGYRNRVDADGDGTWDKATYRGRADGGVDIAVDLNRDGRADFIGHDVDADRTVDYADYDKNHDGVFEKRMYDDNGDGWLDRSVWQEH